VVSEKEKPSAAKSKLYPLRVMYKYSVSLRMEEGVTINRDTTKGVKSLSNNFIGRCKTGNIENRSRHINPLPLFNQIRNGFEKKLRTPLD
jgi:hypothetical protein